MASGSGVPLSPMTAGSRGRFATRTEKLGLLTSTAGFLLCRSNRMKEMTLPRSAPGTAETQTASVAWASWAFARQP
jgi:hypothetical protein